MNNWYTDIEKLLSEAHNCVDCLEEKLNFENQCMDYLDNLTEEDLNERMVIKRVMRGGKSVRKKFCKLATQKQLGGRCVARKAKERVKKSRSMRKAARKRKGKMGKISRKRKRSVLRGKRMGLYKRK